MSVAWLPAEDSNSEPKMARVEIRSALSFLDENKIGTIQPHDDALVVTLRIGGYNVKRVMVDQGSGAEIMYPDIYRGLNLKPEDLTAYDSPLVSFDGKVVIPRGRLDCSYRQVKYPSGDQIEELVRSQSMAWQCLVAAIIHQPEAKSLAFTEGGS
nr:hypothetical protein CFP56_30532 [Quercus suber]